MISVIPFISLLTCVSAQTQTTFSIYTNASDIYPLPTSENCATALAAPIHCDDTIILTIPGSSTPLSNLTSSQLSSLCTPTCYSSLKNAIKLIDDACPGWPYVVGVKTYIASFPASWLQYNYNLTCVMSGSEFCLNTALDSSSNEDSSIFDLPHDELCSDCTLETLNIQMTSPFGWDAKFVQNWTAIQSECGVSFNNTIPSSLLLTDVDPNATSYNVTARPTLSPASPANCFFATYTVQAGDTCHSIAQAHSLSYDQLVAANGFDIDCTLLPPPGQPMCLSGACTLYTVQPGDTCVEIYQAQHISWTQLLAWNPQIDSYCSNIDGQVDKGICISPPGGGYTPTTTVTQATGTPTAIAVPTAPVAPGSDRQVCGLWYQAVEGDTCPQILQTFQITNDTFYELNPSLDEDCENLLAGFDYCVAIFQGAIETTTTPLPTSTFASIISIFDGVDFPSGTGFAQASGNATASPVTGTIPIQTFTPMPTPIPTIAPGTISNDTCLQYYTVQPGDTCFGIGVMFEIEDSMLRDWNPEVDEGCTNLQVGLAYCVYGPITFTFTIPNITVAPTPTTSSTSSSTSLPSGVPTNVASGTITTGCTTYYTVQSGDFCEKIDEQFGISFDDIIAWNPEIDSGCTNIQPGLAYCVSGPTSTTTHPPVTSPTAPGTITTNCAQYYTVVAGDSCPAIESRFSITFAQFQQWNPEVDSDCDNILAGFQYCVAGPTATSVPTTTTTTTPTATPTAVMINPNGNLSKCLDVRGAVFADGAPVQIFTCNGRSGQKWTIRPGEGRVQLAGTTFCLDAGTTPKNGVGMKIWTCFDNLPAQDWFYTGAAKVALANTGLCLDLTNGNLTDTNQVQTWQCTDNDVFQTWTLAN